MRSTIPTEEITQLLSSNREAVERINRALVEVNGTKNLPLWMERRFSSTLATLSADALQGVKVGLQYINERLEELLAEE